MTPPGRAVRWGFLGAGWIAGRALAPAVHHADGAVLQAVAARSAERAAALEPAGRVHATYDDLLADPDVDVVYVCLANDAHLPWAVRALEAGKHVLCEKPLGRSAAEVARMQEAARAAGRLLVEASFYRWHPRVRAAERLVGSGALGPVRSVQAGFCFDSLAALQDKGDYRLDPAMGGGALYDVGCYAVSAALWASSWPAAVRVEAVDVVRHGGGVDLVTAATLRCGDARASVRSAIGEASGQWLRVEGEQGRLELPDPAFTAWTDDPAPLLVDGRVARVFDPVDPYRTMVEAVSAAARGEDAWVVPPGQSLAVARALDAIRAAG